MLVRGGWGVWAGGAGVRVQTHKDSLPLEKRITSGLIKLTNQGEMFRLFRAHAPMPEKIQGRTGLLGVRRRGKKVIITKKTQHQDLFS